MAQIGLPCANHKSKTAGKHAQYVPKNGAAAKTAAKTTKNTNKFCFYVSNEIYLPVGMYTIFTPNRLCINHVHIP